MIANLIKHHLSPHGAAAGHTYPPAMAGQAGYPPPVTGQGYPPAMAGQAGYPPPVTGQGYPPSVAGQGYPPPMDGQGYPPAGYPPPMDGQGYPAAGYPTPAPAQGYLQPMGGGQCYPPPMAAQNYPPLANPITVVGPQFIQPYPMDLSISKKMMAISDHSFAVTDVNGMAMFDVKGIFFSLRDRRVLLDASGHPLVSLQQKILTAHRRWQVFRGESSNDLLFSVKKSSLIQFATKLDVFLATNTKEDVCDFYVKGSWMERSCTIYAGATNTIIAQMHKAHNISSFVLGKQFCPFAVTVYPNVDYAFIIALVVVLNEINIDRKGKKE